MYLAVISDLHLLSKKCEAQRLYNFLKNNTFETLIINGDGLDLWRIQFNKLSKEEQQLHLNVIQRILKLAKKGTRVIFIRGNHDEILWKFLGDVEEFGNIEFKEDFSIDAEGKTYLLVHGDIFDIVVRTTPSIAKLGDWIYDFAMWLNRHYNSIRTKFGYDYWSLSKFAKTRVKKVCNFLRNFESVATKYAADHGYDGIIMGHIHDPSFEIIEGTVYYNTGCWTDQSNCNVLIQQVAHGPLCLLDVTQEGKINV